MLVAQTSCSGIDRSPVPGSVPPQVIRSLQDLSSSTVSLVETEPKASRLDLSGCGVVVTGAAGFIGRHLTRSLAATGAIVTALDERASDRPFPAGVHARRKDLLSADLPATFVGADTVFHLAGRPGVRQSWGPKFESYVRCNLIGTERVVQACATAGVRRLVVASSSSVYGPGVGRPSRESDPTQPISPYGVSKLAAEQLCLAYALRPDVSTSVIALRYFTVYGPGQRRDMLIGRLIRAARTGQPVPIFGSGRQSRDFTYVDDVVAATVSAAQVPGYSEVINVAGGAPATIDEVVHHVEELTGRPVPIDRAPAQDGDVDATCADLTRARLRLGYAPGVGLREGIAHHLMWDTSRDGDV
jgi:nucleoside-diphosphate-sugar epimerase